MFCGVFSSSAHSGAGVSYTCARVADGLVRAGMTTQLHVPWRKAAPAEAAVRAAMPAPLGRVLPRAAARRQERRLLRAVTAAADRERFAYLWPDASLALVRALREAGIPIVREMINCHVATGQRILDRAFAARGLGRGPIRDAHVAYERAVLALVDRVVAPGPGVVASLIENGVPEHRIIHADYGWDPARIAPAAPRDGPPRFLFAGTLCARKGTDTLVRAWRRAGIAGRLVLLGRAEPGIAALAGGLEGEGIVHHPFALNVARHYAEADVFVMPALEEGGPLVSYEAIGAGLPVIATAMGAGHAVVDGLNGVIVPPDDEVALAEALRSLADDAPRRRRFAAASAERATDFTWERVGARRAASLAGSLFG